MCDALIDPPRDGGPQLKCVSTSDCCYLISLWHCYEGVIAWHKKRVLNTLAKYPNDHQWVAGKPQPKDEDAKEEARDKTYWAEENKDPKKKPKRHHFEPKPDPVVSDSEADLWIRELSLLNAKLTC